MTITTTKVHCFKHRRIKVFIAINEGCKETLWMQKFLQELSQNQGMLCSLLYCNSESAIHLSKNSTFHARLKHFKLRYYWMHDVYKSKLFQVKKIHTKDNSAYMMTIKEKLEFCK